MHGQNREGWAGDALRFLVVLGLIGSLLGCAPVVGSQATAQTEPSTQVAPEPAPSATQVDYSAVVDLAISLSYPLYEDGSKRDPDSYTDGGDTDIPRASEHYLEVKQFALERGTLFGNERLPYLDSQFANCSAFTGAIVISTIDPEFPGRTAERQRMYLEQPENGWVKVEDTRASQGVDYSKLQPGDLFVTQAVESGSGHTWLWIGEYGGQQNVIAEASYKPAGTTGAHLPALRTESLAKREGNDSRGRYYDVWRYVGGEKLPGSN